MLGIRLTDGCCRGRALWHPFPRASGASEGGNGRKAAVADGKAIVTVRTPEGRSAGCAVYVGQAAADYEKRDRQLTKAALGGMGILGALFLLLGIAL